MRRRICILRVPLILSAQFLWLSTSYSSELHIHCDDPLNSSSSSPKPPPNKLNVHSPSSCRNVACNDHISLLRRSIKAQLDAAALPSEIDNIAPDMNDDVLLHESKHQSGVPTVYSGCPVDRSQLGRSSWDLLHTMAANYPDDPSPETQRLLLNFFEALAHLYPCTYCAKDFQELMKISPPRCL
jgi:FAD-linked sulfhydryl oxidase